MTDKRDEIYSKSLRAGRRTYFFDVRSTRADDYYLTITESKRDFNEDGTPYYKKHKIYLYKEDFQNFKDHLNEMVEYIINEKGEEVISFNKDENSSESKKEENKEDSSSDFTEVNFEDLGKEE
ncbi:MAG: DNA-binding protein [Flavobacteriales bacterium]|nr:DNA-binding protein [Flavobacteriales bacterium]|tara:strand:+ start:169 stop:537 length:369 start_codon:yes stop_codon:yes gene_type:complete